MPLRNVDHEYIALSNSPENDDPEVDTSTRHGATSRGRRRRGDPEWPAMQRSSTGCWIVGTLCILVALTIVHRIFVSWLHSVPAPDSYFSTGDPKVHNERTLGRLARCRSLNLLRDTASPHLEQLPADEEARRHALGCGTNQTTLIILSSLFFSEAFTGSTAGEAIYAQSAISTLNFWGYSYVYTSQGWYNHGMQSTMDVWDEWQDISRTVLADPEQVKDCWGRNETGGCLKSEANPGGIPAWKLLSFWYWDDARHPLGPSFTLSPSMYNNNTFLSYSIEPTCRLIPKSTNRPARARPQAYLLAKQETYFYPPRFSWTIPFLGELKSKMGIDIVVGMRNDNDTIREELDRAGIPNHGRLPKLDFYRKLGQSFVLVGVGQPRISPSPWDGLCMGVPFINPILEWDEARPDDRSRWHAQQWRMATMDPPYVYHIHAHDLEGLEQAMQAALQSPIDSYIPSHMRFETVCGYMADVLARDWQSEAQAIIDGRGDAGEADVF